MALLLCTCTCYVITIDRELKPIIGSLSNINAIVNSNAISLTSISRTRVIVWAAIQTIMRGDAPLRYFYCFKRNINFVNSHYRLFPLIFFSNMLLIKHGPCVHTISYGDRSFAVAAPQLWNNIPLHIQSSPSINVFKNTQNFPI